jgi:hypothetical protein
VVWIWGFGGFSCCDLLQRWRWWCVLEFNNMADPFLKELAELSSEEDGNSSSEHLSDDFAEPTPASNPDADYTYSKLQSNDGL